MQRNGGSKARVAVVMGGSSGEREISIRSGSEVLRALQTLGYEARSLDYDERFIDALRAGLVVPQIGIGCLALELVDSAAQTVDVEHPLHSGQSGVECRDVSLTVGVHA